MKVLVVEVSEEPEHSGTEHLAKEHDKRGKIEDEDHTSQPVKKHHRTYMQVVGGGGWEVGGGGEGGTVNG